MLKSAASEDDAEIISCLQAMICYNNSNTRKEDMPKLKGIIEQILAPEKRGNAMETLGDAFREEGIKLGLEQGLEKGIMLTAKNMLNKGSDVKFISECTGLSIAQIKALQSD